MSPKGILSIWDSPKTAVTVVPLPGSDSIWKLPPVLSAAYLKKWNPKPDLPGGPGGKERIRYMGCLFRGSSRIRCQL